MHVELCVCSSPIVNIKWVNNNTNQIDYAHTLESEIQHYNDIRNCVQNSNEAGKTRIPNLSSLKACLKGIKDSNNFNNSVDYKWAYNKGQTWPELFSQASPNCIYCGKENTQLKERNGTWHTVQYHVICRVSCLQVSERRIHFALNFSTSSLCSDVLIMV